MLEVPTWLDDLGEPVMSAQDRLAKGYEPRFDIDQAVGSQGELFVANIIDSLASGSNRIEVKTDERVAQTGNVFIEFECRYGGVYRPSGIQISKAELLMFVLPAGVAIVAPTSTVKAVAYSHFRLGHIASCTKGSHPTKGVVIPVGQFVMELYRHVIEEPRAS